MLRLPKTMSSNIDTANLDAESLTEESFGTASNVGTSHAS